MKTQILNSPIFSFLIFFLLVSLTAASGEVPVDFEADRLDYNDEQGIIEGWGNARLAYEETNLKADYIWFSFKSRDMIARGNVVLHENLKEIHAEEIEYNLASELTTALKVTCFEKPWYIKADKFTKISADEYLAEGAEFTTCNLPSPHYRFTAKRTRICPGIRLLTHHALFYAGKVPLMYLPLYKRSLKDTPSGFVMRPGYSSEKGAFALSHYNWHFSEKLHGRWYLDFFDNTGWGKGLDINFSTGPGSGYFYGYHIDEREAAGEELPTERWKLHFRHRQKITENIREIIRIDKLSDEDFNEDYLNDEVLRFLNRSELEKHRPEGSLSVTMTKPGYTSSIYLRKRVNSFLEVTEKLPQVSLDLVESNIPRTSFYYDFDTDFSYLRVSPEGEKVIQMEAHPQLSHRTSIGWLKLKPTVRADGFWYSENELEEENISQGSYRASCAMTMANGIWKIFDTPGGQEIKKVRHLILPKVTCYYKPEPPEERENIYSFCDRIGNEEELIKVELYNSIEGKTESGKKVKLFDLDMYSFYNRLNEEEPWQNIHADLKIKSIRNVSLRTLASYNPYIEKFESLDSDMEVTGRKWKFSAGTRFYEPGGEKNTFDVIGKVSGNLGAKWKIDLQSRYDLNGEDFKVRRVTLYRDLHCWEAQLFWQEEKNGEEEESTIFLAFRIKGVGAGIKTPFQ